MKIALVTGASSGMGREAVIQIADRFSGVEEIWVISRREELLQQLKSQVPVPLRIFPLDLTKDEELNTLKKALEQQQPEVKILVNAAGYGKIGAVLELGEKDTSGMVQLNCQVLCVVTRLILPYLSNNSRILQFASSAGFLPQPGFAIYAATKAFVLSYSRALHFELKSRDIAVTAVCPGPVKTEFFDIAETTGQMPIYKKLVMADPKRVVKQALRDSMMGKTVSVYGITMKAFFLLSKCVPHALLLSIMEQYKENVD